MSTYAKYPATPSSGGGGGGTVTSVALTVPSFLSVSGSPITTSGTLAISLSNEPANTVFAGPTSGPSAPPTFRALVAADIPTLPYALDSFTIIQTDTGTFPTASSATDTLTLHSSSANLTIAGNSGTKTVTFGLTGLQPSGNYITALTGDATATGPGSVPLTLATVNANVGSFNYSNITVNAKGLVTAASSNATPITSINGNATPAQTIVAGTGISVSSTAGATTITNTSPSSGGTVTSVAQTTNSVSGLTVTGSPITTSGTLALTLAQATTSTNGYLSSTDWNTFNGKQAAGNYITALTGDVTATGPGSVAATLATVNTNVGSFTYSSITVNAKGLITAASSGAAPTGTVTSVALTVPSFLSVSGSPITTSGTLAVTLATESANTVFAGPASGSAATPTFRAIVAADLPTSTVVTKTANYTLVAGDRGTRFLANTNGGAFSFTLLSAATATSGYSFYLIDKVGTFNTNNLSLIPNGTDKISGLNVTKVFQTNWGGWYIFTDGTDWYVV